MATKAELIEAILELNKDAITADLTHDELTKLLSETRDEAEAGALADEILAPSVTKAAPHPYSIAQGKSVTCKKGVLAHGDEIKAEHLGGGQESLDALVQSNVVIKA